MNPNQLNNENLPAVAHAATHIQNFSWYHPAPSDHVEKLIVTPASGVNIAIPLSSSTTTTTTTTVFNSLGNAPAANFAPLSANLSAPSSSISVKDIETGNLTPLMAKSELRQPESVNIPLENLVEEAVIEVKPEEWHWNFGAGAWISDLEEEERARRISKGVDAILLGQWRQLILPSIRKSNERSVSSSWMKRRVPQEILDLEENERTWRILNWGDSSRSLQDKFRANIFPYIRARSISPRLPQLLKDASDAIDSFNRVVDQFAADVSATVQSTLEGSLVKVDERLSEQIDDPILAIAEMKWGGEPISFKWPRQVPYYIRDLEELEREYRILKGINPILAGKFNRFIFPAIRARGMPKTLPAMIGDAARSVTHKAEDTISMAREMIHDATTPVMPAPKLYFEKSGASIGLGQGESWSWSLRKFPADIHALEEEERARRMREGVDPVLLGRHRRFVYRQILGFAWARPTPVIVKEIKHAVKENAHGWSSFVGSLTGMAKELVHDVTEVARGTLGYVDPNSTAFVTKEEEKERSRRMNQKTDPMMEARKRRVEEQLLHQIKPAC